MLPLSISPNIPRIYTAIAEWLSCMICLLEVKHRVNTRRFILISAGVLFLQSIFLYLTPGLDNLLWILCMAAAGLMMYAFIYLCADVNWKDAAYYTIRAFVIAEFAASFEWQIDLFFHESSSLTPVPTGSSILILVVCYAILFGICERLYRRYQSKEQSLNITGRELASYAIIGLAVFCMSNFGFVAPDLPFYGNYSDQIYNVRTLVDLGGVAIMYAYHVQRMDLRVRYELESVQNLLHNQYAQYKQAREAVDLINYKYHDLKHHIIALRAEENMDKRNAYLNQMEEELKNYEAQNKTGNNVLDVMLTLKTLYCQKHGVTMTSVIDGTLFDFMNAMDISSIFGNALDNAIECELKIPDKEKRLIHINAHARKNFLIILFDNYYEGDMKLGNGLPETTKKDAQFHGYGLKSVQYTAQKYGGAVDVSANDHWFHLKILIPMPAQTETAKAGSDGAAETVNTVAATAATETTKAAANTAREKNNNTAI